MESNYNFSIKIDYSDYGDKVYVVRYDDFPNVIGVGDNIEEAIVEAQGNLKVYLIYCKDEGIDPSFERTKGSLNSEEQKAQMFDYLMQSVRRIDNEREVYYISFNNDTPWLDCIKIDKEHYEKIKKLKDGE